MFRRGKSPRPAFAKGFRLRWEASARQVGPACKNGGNEGDNQMWNSECGAQNGKTWTPQTSFTEANGGKQGNIFGNEIAPFHGTMRRFVSGRWSSKCDLDLRAWIGCGLLVLGSFSSRAQQPVLGVPQQLSNAPAAQFTLTNCSDTNFLYIIQLSTNLQSWSSVITNLPCPDGSTSVAPATNSSCFYRLVVIPRVPIPMYRAAITTISNFNFDGHNGSSVDSFDSSDPLYSTNGQYSVLLRKANATVLSEGSILLSHPTANANIYGRVMTGPGTQQSAVQIGSQGAVGDAAWNANPANRGKIQPGAWAGNFYLNFPDLRQPTFPGSALPSPVGGVITLPAGIFTFPTNFSAMGINVTGPAVLWVKGSFAPTSLTIAPTNNASLVVFVGTTNVGAGDAIDLAAAGEVNAPGLAQNLQVFGLPSLTSINLLGMAAFNGTIYAPSADVTAGGGGPNAIDISGSFTVRSLSLSGHWNFHYDEHLLVVGPGL
jgi:hypothetical protein